MLRLIDTALTATGAAFLVVSHDVLAVAPLVHRMVVLHQGRIVEDGPPDRLLDSPTHPTTQRLAETARRLAVRPGSAIVLERRDAVGTGDLDERA